MTPKLNYFLFMCIMVNAFIFTFYPSAEADIYMYISTLKKTFFGKCKAKFYKFSFI